MGLSIIRKWRVARRSRPEQGRRRLVTPGRTVLVCLACVVGMAGAAFALASNGGHRSPSKEARGGSGQEERFPLWQAVPAKAFAVLGEGTLGKTEWGAYVYRGHGSNAREEPCLVVASFFTGPSTNSGGGLFSPGTPECGPLAPPSSRVVMNTAGTSVETSSDDPATTTKAIAMTFSRTVRRVEIELSPGPSEKRQTNLLSARQAAKAKVVSLRYVAFAVPRGVCVEAIHGFDASGVEVLNASEASLSSCS